MSDELVEIYRAKSMQQAHLLRHRLEDAGIRATVMNAALEAGSGVDVVGWVTQSRVMVRDDDAVPARQIALAYDELARLRAEESAGPEYGNEDDDEPEEEDSWPRCPSCGARRKTFCPVCHTSGTGFPSADAAESLFPDGGADGEESLEPSDALLLCTTCDEPFAPRYLRRCEWCGHEFPDGIAPADPPPPDSPVSWALGLVFLAAVIVLATIGVLFLGHLPTLR